METHTINRLLAGLTVLMLLGGCTNGENRDGWYNGSLETDPVRITAPAAGKLLAVIVDEGDFLKKGQLVAVIDTAQLVLKRDQINLQMNSVAGNRRLFEARKQETQARLDRTNDLLKRTRVLANAGSATQQKVLELETEARVLEAKIQHINEQMNLLEPRLSQLENSLEQIVLQLEDAVLIAPASGLVLTRYKQTGEWVAPGLPIVEMANLGIMTAKVFVEETHLTQVKVGESLPVRIDGIDETLTGTVKRIASRAEFTPKFIQTGESRTSLVYAVDIGVADTKHRLKIGMPVDVRLFDSAVTE